MSSYKYIYFVDFTSYGLIWNKMAARKRHQNQNTNANAESSNTTRKKAGKKKESNEDNGMSGDLKYKIFIAVLGKDHINFLLFCVHVIPESLANTTSCESHEFAPLFFTHCFRMGFIKYTMSVVVWEHIAWFFVEINFFATQYFISYVQLDKVLFSLEFSLIAAVIL